MVNNGNISKKTRKVSNRTRLLAVLLGIGVCGLSMVIWLMQKVPTVAAGAAPSYANRGTFSNLNEIFQIPALMFFGVLVAYAMTELYKSYRAMNDPETYRRKNRQYGMNRRRRTALH